MISDRVIFCAAVLTKYRFHCCSVSVFFVRPGLGCIQCRLIIDVFLQPH